MKRLIRLIPICLILAGCRKFEFGPYNPPLRSIDVKGKVIELMKECPRSGLVKIVLVLYTDTICSYIANDSFRIPGQDIIFDMSPRIGQRSLMGCGDSLPEVVSLYNLRLPEE